MSYSDDFIEFNQWKQTFLSTARPDLANILLTNILTSQDGVGGSSPSILDLDVEADLTRIFDSLYSTGIKTPLTRATVTWDSTFPNNWLTVIASNPNRKAFFIHLPSTEPVMISIGYKVTSASAINNIVTLSPGGSYHEGLPFNITKHEILIRVERERYDNAPVSIIGWHI